MGPTRAYRARKPRILGLRWPKPLNFRLIVLRGHPVEVRGSPMTSQVLTASLHRLSGSRGAKKMARDLQESVVLSGKRTRTATVTFVAESVGLIKQEHRRIVLPRSRFNDTWLQQHLSTTLTPAAPAVPDEQSNNADIARVTGEMRAKFPCRLAVQGDRSQGHLKMA